MISPLRIALESIPEGYSEGHYLGRRYRLEKTLYAGGKGLKFFARELGGTNFVSLNLYQLSSGDLLKPCEMPEAKVRDFVLRVEVVQKRGARGRSSLPDGRSSLSPAKTARNGGMSGSKGCVA